MTQRLEMLEKMVGAGTDDPFVHYAHAMELRSLGRLAESLVAYRAVIARFSDYVPTYLMAGQVADELGEVDVASEVLTQGIDRARAAGDGKAVSELESALDAL